MSVYTKEQNDWNFQQDTVENFWNRVRNNAIENELNELGLDKKSTILEIGCGVGVVGRKLLEKKFNYWGCEPSEVPYILFDKNKFKKQYHHELSEEFRKDVKVIILADVIEHIENDKKFIKEVFDSFPSLEAMLITVPAYKILWNQNDNMVGHFRRYTRKSLDNLIREANCKKCNFRIIKKKHLFFTLSLLMCLSKVKNFLMGEMDKLSVVRNESVVDLILEKISNFETKFRLPFGSSIMIVVVNENHC